jgi:hypothetical protein
MLNSKAPGLCLHAGYHKVQNPNKSMHTSWKVLHTFVDIRTTLINSAVIMRSRHGTSSPRKQDVKNGAKGDVGI